MDIQPEVYRISKPNGSPMDKVKGEAKISPNVEEVTSDLRVSVSVGQLKVESVGSDNSSRVIAEQATRKRLASRRGVVSSGWMFVNVKWELPVIPTYGK